MPELNLGGGFGIAYTDVDEPLGVDDIARRLTDVVADTCTSLGIPVPVLAVEPGRVIAGPAGLTLYEVGTVKDVLVDAADGPAVRRYVSVDGG